MSPVGIKLELTARDMRRSFDESFAAPPRPELDAPEHLLALQVAGANFAVRLCEIHALIDRKARILPVPSSLPDLLGLTGIRGTVVPVFSLAALLGFAREPREPAWLLHCGTRQAPLALGFEFFAGYLQAARSEICPIAEAERARYVTHSVRHGGLLHAIIAIPQMIHSITARRAPPLAASSNTSGRSSGGASNP
jgi:chemotaxis signal transduction protein